NIHNLFIYVFFFFQAEDGIRDFHVTGVQTCALPIYSCKKWRDYWPLNPIPRNLNGFSNCARRPARSRESLGASMTEFRPDGAVVRRLVHGADGVVNSGVHTAIRQVPAGENQVDTQAALGIGLKPATAVIEPAETVGFLRIRAAKGIHQAPIQNLLQPFTLFR